MNGRHDGLFDGLREGTVSGLHDGLANGLVDGLFPNEPPLWDIDALVFFRAVPLGNYKHRYALNRLVVGLKRTGLWPLLRVIYPMIGGTENAHKYNLKNPVDSNLAYRLQFFNAPGHNDYGVAGTGTTQYAETFLNPFTNFAQHSAHMCYYTRTNSLTAGQNVMGTFPIPAGNRGFSLNLSGSGGSFIGHSNTNVLVTNSTSRGCWVASRTANNDNRLYTNGVQRGLVTVVNTETLPNDTAYLGARHDPTGPLFFSSHQCAFASMGAGLNPAQVVALSQLVQQYQTLLGRAF